MPNNSCTEVHSKSNYRCQSGSVSCAFLSVKLSHLKCSKPNSGSQQTAASVSAGICHWPKDTCTQHLPFRFDARWIYKKKKKKKKAWRRKSGGVAPCTFWLMLVFIWCSERFQKHQITVAPSLLFMRYLVGNRNICICNREITIFILSEAKIKLWLRNIKFALRAAKSTINVL